MNRLPTMSTDELAGSSRGVGRTAWTIGADRSYRSLALVLCAAALGGCTSLSGYDATSKFACPAPGGVLCDSMSGIYAKSQEHTLPAQLASRPASGPASPTADLPTGVLTSPIHSGTPIRSAPSVARVWFAPWEDSDGDLHDQSYLYLTLDGGRWLLDHNQRRIRDAYRPVRPPVAQPATSDTPAAPLPGAAATPAAAGTTAAPAARLGAIPGLPAGFPQPGAVPPPGVPADPE